MIKLLELKVSRKNQYFEKILFSNTLVFQIKVRSSYGPLAGSTYPDLQFLGNFREKSKKFPTPTVSKKLSEISPNFPKNLRALLPDLQLRTGNFCRF